ncbi:SDR family oxidoreductase [uncultured Agitococcus sp.]|uniref:SDR family NAD(P)-dependent oxidoreductase n=1 Tax=uncultured Agitococcus sp. TaxID=1506599 RepID=UPI00261F86FA|nr:SDR family oxidoreductase [uncultured Agitococcus sp.]
MTTLATVITGASSGIGEALAHLFAREQQTLVLVARRKDKLEGLAKALNSKYGVKVHVIALDLQQMGAAAQLMNEVSNLKLTVDTLVNNAGFGVSAPFAKSDASQTSGMMQLNMVALTELTHMVLPMMLERGHGRIMNIASVVAFQPCPYFAVYAATKAYVLSFTEALAEEMRGRGILVTAVCPGSTATEFHDVAHTKGSLLTQIQDTAETVAEEGYKALNNGKSVVVTGLMNKPLPLVNRLVPRKAMTWATSKLMGR